MTHTCPKCGYVHGPLSEGHVWYCGICNTVVYNGRPTTIQPTHFDLDLRSSSMTDEMPTPNNANPVEQCLENLERQFPPLDNLSEADKRWLHQVGVAA